MAEQNPCELRLQIARLRRRIDHHIRAAGQSGRELLRPGTYVRRCRRYPGFAMLAALGTGLTLSAVCGAPRLGRWLAVRLVRRAGGRIRSHLWREWRKFWAAAPGPTQAATTTETHHAGT
jgi:hypothetical protein